MEFDPRQIEELTRTIWESMLDLPIEPGAILDEPAPQTRSTAACVQIAGAWNGAVMLDCSAEVSRLAAAAMFGLDKAQVTVAELQDAVAELVNMIGGNVKALLPDQCYLSLPAVVEGGDYSSRVPGSRLVERVAFNCQGHRVAVTIREKCRVGDLASVG